MNRAVVAIAMVTGAVGVAGAVASVVLVDLSLLIVLARVALFTGVGVVIAARHPRHPVAWILLVSALLTSVQVSADSLSRLGAEHGWQPTFVHALAVSTSWPWFAALFLPLTVGLLRFPDGRLQGQFWRVTEVAATLSITAFTVGLGVVSAASSTAELLADGSPRFTGWQRVVFDGCLALFAIVALCLVSTLVSLVVRWRRSDEVQREQIRWVAAAGVVAIVAQVLVLVFDVPGWAQDLVSGIGYGLIALAVGIAITRYKLYEIDRIVSRTVTYAVVLGVLAGVYVGVLLGLAALVPDRYGQLGVAAATLAVALLAVPLTRRVRRAVDHRFQRSRFDAEQVVAAFAGRLRARPERGDIPSDLVEVLSRTVQPSHASVWLVPR